MILRIVGIMALGMTLLTVPAHASTYPNGTRANGQSVWNQAMAGKSTSVNGQGSGSGSRPSGVTGNADVLDAAGNVVVSGGATVGVNGKNVPVQANGKISKEDIAAAALSALACSGGGVAGAVVCGGVALALPIATNWMANAGVRVNPTTKELERTEPSGAVESTGNEYMVTDLGGADLWFPSAEGACKAYLGRRNASPGQEPYNAVFVSSGERCVFDIQYKSGGVLQAGASRDLYMRGSTCPAGNYVQPDGSCTPTAGGGWVRAGIPDATGLMNNSRIPSADIVRELESAGQTAAMPIKDVSVSGPSSVPGASSTTINNTTNTTTTNTTTNNYTYNTNTVTNISSVTTSRTTRNSDGTVTNEETTTNTPGDENDPRVEPEPEEAVPSDSALPPVPSLYERKYPNGMEGIWTEYKDQLKGTSLVSLVGKLMPNVGDGGSCPSWMLNLDMAQWATFGTHDVAPPCWIWDVAKAILILSALLLARSLIFGG